MGVFDPAAGTAEPRLDAGWHGYWLLTQAPDGSRPPIWTKNATGIPLGIDPTFEFPAATLKTWPGLLLIVFSDGVAELAAGGAPDGAQPGVEGAIHALA